MARSKSHAYLIKMANQIWYNASEQYKMAVPYLKEDAGIMELRNPLFTNELAYNTFYTGLTNMIYKTVFKTDAMFKNPLDILKKGNTELGADIREIANDLLEEHQYTMSDDLLADVLKLDPPTTYQAIHRLNRKVYYKVSISEAELELAMNTWESFDEMFIKKAELLYNSNYVSEFEWCKDTLRQAVQADKVEREMITEVTSEATGKGLVKAIKNTVSAFKYPSYEHTGLYRITNGVNKIKTWTSPENTVLVIPSAIMNELDTDVLAVAFNVDKLAFKTNNVLEVDTLGYVYDYVATDDTTVTAGTTYYKKNSDGTYEKVTPAGSENPKTQGWYTRSYFAIDAMVFDAHFPQIYDKLIKFANMPIASALVEQRYLHIWQTYSVSVFCNARVFIHSVDEDDIPAGYEFFKNLEADNSITPVTI